MTQTAGIERLVTRVRQSARDGSLIETAQVKLIGLDEVRQAAGPRWPRMREQVREGSLKIIASRIGPDDAIIACGDGFLVVFADAAAEDTVRLCSEIHDALIAFYLGEDALQRLRPDIQRESASAASLAGVVADVSQSAHLKIQRNNLRLGRFWPLWSTQRRCIAAHLCAPVIESFGARRMGYAQDFLERAAHNERDYLDLDLCLLEQAAAAAEAPEATAVGVTVHVTTMQSRKARTTYFSHAAANLGPAQQRMFVTIAEIEPGTPLISLTEWSSGLSRAFPRVALDLHHSDRAISGLASAGVWAASHHLPDARDGASLRAALHKLNAWCRTLRAQGIQPMVNGFADWAFLDLSSYSDLAFASGDGLWPSQPALNNASAENEEARPVTESV